jgi:predicted TIM-barrel fold metal-dependent hydrolase
MLRSIDFVKDLQGKPTDYLKNIYVDTGGDTTKANFELALDLFGPKHILWGSDWPGKRDTRGAINAVKNLDVSEEDKTDILYGNLEKMLK